VTLLLALDTSTRTAGVAVFDGQQVLSETTWLAGREHTTRLLVEAESALSRVGHVAADVKGVVVACGPGSFTGTRVAISVAKGIAAGLRVPAWGVSTLDVMAAAACDNKLPVRALVEAGRARFATALYAGGQCIEPPRLATLEQFVELLSDQTFVIGELPAEARARLSQVPTARVASPAASVRRAGFLAELGWRLAQSGDPGDPRAIDALYVS
jgi:tRNA threonylcarbamoyl adenosine modification protein YeaZ